MAAARGRPSCGVSLAPNLSAALAIRSPGSVAPEIAGASVALGHTADEYPDAVIVQTHRDPLNVISSIAALTHHLAADVQRRIQHRRLRGPVRRRDHGRPRARDGSARRGAVSRQIRIVDVQFSDFMGDPWSTIKGIYRKLGRELSPAGENRCARSLPRIPATAGQQVHLVGHRPGRRGGPREGTGLPGTLRRADRTTAVTTPGPARSAAS